MKKIFLVFLAILLFSISLSAVVPQKSLGMDITAYNGQYHDIIITPVYSSLSDPIGMPFDLTKDDVAYVETDATAGREIAQWSLHTNFSPIDIKISAPNLTYRDSSIQEITSIPYILFFPYEYEENGQDVQGFLRIESGVNTYSSRNDVRDTNPIASKTDGGNIDTSIQPVRFMLAEDVEITDRDLYPSGTYSADVTVIVEVE